MAWDFAGSTAGWEALVEVVRPALDSDGVRETFESVEGDVFAECSSGWFLLFCNMVPSTPGPMDFRGWRIAAEAAELAVAEGADVCVWL